MVLEEDDVDVYGIRVWSELVDRALFQYSKFHSGMVGYGCTGCSGHLDLVNLVGCGQISWCSVRVQRAVVVFCVLVFGRKVGCNFVGPKITLV